MGVFVQTNTASIRAQGQPVGYVIEENGCWQWIGATTPAGYGHTWENGRSIYAHRMMFQRHRGPIPSGLHLDHLCRNRACVNPDHLEAVTQRENTMRGAGPTAANNRKMVCKRGHPLSPENTYTRPNGMRLCRLCQKRPALAARKLHLQRIRRQRARGN